MDVDASPSKVMFVMFAVESGCVDDDDDSDKDAVATVNQINHTTTKTIIGRNGGLFFIFVTMTILR